MSSGDKHQTCCLVCEQPIGADTGVWELPDGMHCHACGRAKNKYSIGPLVMLATRYARVLVEDRWQVRHPNPGCRSCHRGIEQHDEFCKSCGAQKPFENIRCAPQERFKVTCWRMDGLCYPPSYCRSSVDEAAQALLDELEGRES